MADLLSVAALAGVSRATAARAFSHPEKLRPATRQKVMEAASRLAFRPNRVAQQLRTQATRIIGVLVPSLDNPVFAEQLQAMEVAARHAGYSLLITTTDYQADREAAIIEEMLRQRVDGLVLTVADTDSSEVLDTLGLESVPYLLVYNQPDPGRDNVAAISVDNRTAMAEATEHLLALGHRHVGMVAGPILQSDRARLRHEGYRQAMLNRGLTPRPLIEMPHHTRIDLAVLEPFLSTSERLTSLICTNDMLAIHLMGVLQRAGITIPGDISVVGFDGIAIGALMHPSLCTVVQPRAAIGQAAVDTLLGMISGNRPALTTLPHALRPGESVGSPQSQPQPLVSISLTQRRELT
ncbi:MULTISPECIES: LacI family DNA-binding transcriptional regulator [Halomonadaceae]|uniref:LacI family DNA-binding transcriptional regulator n=1 Tax=Halomonadaceae TaxID=28256 RepID=UPI00159AC11B|nr:MULTISPECIES: LacI family DNA-binding transcriptional regulator [Halomonas]QJQ96129.1 LacI family DNA-binding transcriptional regulator [Halomonas sp. PA5]